MERTKSLSIGAIKAYRIFLISLVTVLFGVYLFLMSRDGQTSSLILVGVYCVFLGFQVPKFKKFLNQIREVSYDAENLYVKEKDQEVMIPLSGVKDIEIASLGGIYKFNLYDKTIYDGAILCKTSLWYPFNHKKVDKELNRVRRMVRKAQSARNEKTSNALPSNL